MKTVKMLVKTPAKIRVKIHVKTLANNINMLK
jgi:hypothetical protein